jgi:chemotaxis response regulator CheB
VAEALHAIELAAREFADGRALLAPGEREAILDQVAQMEASLGERWPHRGSVPASLGTRIGSVTALLRQAATTEASTGAVPDGVPDAGRVLALVASGVLLGLSEALHGPAQHRPA